MTSRQDALSAMQNTVVAINGITTKLGNIFPQTTAQSTTAPTGAATITFTSSVATAFLLITTSSGGQFKIPLYA